MPDVMRQILNILARLRGKPEVETAVLATMDGLAIDANMPGAGQTAAVAGFMVAATRQSTAMLGVNQAQALLVTLTNDSFIVLYPFTAADSQLILAVLFNQPFAYKRLLAQTMRHIQRIMENKP